MLREFSLKVSFSSLTKAVALGPSSCRTSAGKPAITDVSLFECDKNDVEEQLTISGSRTRQRRKIFTPL